MTLRDCKSRTEPVFDNLMQCVSGSSLRDFLSDNDEQHLYNPAS